MSFTNTVTYQNPSLGQKDTGFVRAVPRNINEKRHRCKEQTFGLWEKTEVG